MNRRHFLMTSAAAGVATRASMLASANDTVRIACTGIRSQGHEHIRRYLAMKNVEIAALCDVDESVLNERLAEVEKRSGKRPAAYTDFRKLLEDKTIDAVSIATPNHHHTLQTIWACQAGKDVYVEKPCSHDMFEARQIAAVMDKYGRLVQHGQPGELAAAGQIPYGQHVGPAAVDRLGGLDMVHGPDRARAVPMEDVQ